MIDPQTYKDSGVLELFVTGNLPKDEAAIVASQIANNSELKQEVVKIENALMHLARAAAPFIPKNFSFLRNLLDKRKDTKVVELAPKKSIAPYLGWAAALLLLAGLGYFFLQNRGPGPSLEWHYFRSV